MGRAVINFKGLLTFLADFVMSFLWDVKLMRINCLTNPLTRMLCTFMNKTLILTRLAAYKFVCTSTNVRVYIYSDSVQGDEDAMMLMIQRRCS